jgi:carboxypeptidase C (cathepsin A)
LQGDRLPGSLFDSIASQVAAYSGLGVDYVKRSRLRVSDERFFKELLREQGLATARLDSRFVGFDADDAGEKVEDDASYSAMAGAFKAGIQQVLGQQFGWSGEAPYHLLAPLYKSWRYNDHENKYLATGPLLRDALHRDPNLRVYVASGYYDLATPHAAGDHSLAHLGLRPGVCDGIQVRYFEAGHMMYLQAEARRRMAEDLRRFIQAA